MAVTIATALALLTLLQAAPSMEEQQYNLELKREVDASVDCLTAETYRHIAPGQVSMTDDDRSKIRTAVADACYKHAEGLARLSSDVRKDPTALKRVVVQMLAQIWVVSDGLTTMRLQKNAEEAANATP